MLHPAQGFIEALHEREATPRLHVNLECDGAVAPDFVIERWGQELVIDLDPSYPLNLAFTEVGVEADLSFGGFVTRCVFPWDAIYFVGDRETGRGLAFEQNVPEAVRRKRQPQIQVKSDGAAAGKPQRSKGESRLKRRKSPEPEAAPKLAAVDVEAPAERTPPSDSEAAEEQAKKRRSAFRVIDGGE